MAAKWVIKYWPAKPGRKNEIEDWFNSLTIEQAESVAQEVALLEKCGNDLKMPHSKPLKKKLFELRERRYAYRIYLCVLQVFHHCFSCSWR